MMQDYAKVLPSSVPSPSTSDSNKADGLEGGGVNVGFTTAPQWIGYSPAKNSIAEGFAKLKAGVGAMSPSTAEADQ
jgi:hypothetical protein